MSWTVTVALVSTAALAWTRGGRGILFVMSGGAVAFVGVVASTKLSGDHTIVSLGEANDWRLYLAAWCAVVTVAVGVHLRHEDDKLGPPWDTPPPVFFPMAFLLSAGAQLLFASIIVPVFAHLSALQRTVVALAAVAGFLLSRRHPS